MVVVNIDPSQKATNQTLTSDDLGPLSEDNASVKKWLRGVWYFTLGWSFEVHYPNNIEVSDDCYYWSFLQKYSFIDRGTITVTLDMDRDVCQSQVTFSTDEYSLVWISFMAMFFSLISFTSFVLYFHGMSQHLEKMQKVYDRRVQEEAEQKQD